MSGAHRTRLPVIFVLAALAAALLGACGDSSSASSSDQFRGQTKSPLLDFGEEGSDSELEEADEAVSDFLATRSKEDWTAICAQLSKPLLDKLEHLAISSTGLADKSCPAFLDAFVVLSPQEKKEGAAIDGGSMRRQGAKAYLIYGQGKNVYATPLDEEDGEWRVAALSAERLG